MMENDDMPPTMLHSREYGLALSKLLRRTSSPKLGLDRIKNLLAMMGFDRSAMRIIQVVGTNGKGSTVAFIESILRAHGYTCGLFTSPHLCSARERIRIDGHLISEAEFVDAYHHVALAADKIAEEASFFECVLAMAMWVFQKHKLQFAIIEAGLGGRLDATTALLADVLGVTSIDFDHQNILGDTVNEIAREKIGAARPQQQVITVAQSHEVMAELKTAAHAKGFALFEAHDTDFALGLFGRHQRRNAGLAVALLRALLIKMDDEGTGRGLLDVNWPGRFEIMKSEVPFVLDGAHNPAGMHALLDALKAHERFACRPIFLVYGSLEGHNVTEKVAVLKKCDLAIERVYLHEPRNPRAVSRPILHDVFVQCGLRADLINAFTSIHDIECQAAKCGAAIVVCGSLYTVGEIRSVKAGIAMDSEGPRF